MRSYTRVAATVGLLLAAAHQAVALQSIPALRRPSSSATSSSRITVAPVCVDEAIQAADAAKQFLPIVAGAAILVAGASSMAKPKKATVPVSKPTESDVPAPAPAPKITRRKWPSVGGGSGIHRMAGRCPAPPPREQFVPPPGWTPPRKPVLSWYDRGVRLAPAAAPAPAASSPAPKNAADTSISSQASNFFATLFGGAAPAPAASKPAGTSKARSKKWASVGGASGVHRMAGRFPAPPPREQFVPPPGWTPPRKPVLSWYDRGIRL